MYLPAKHPWPFYLAAPIAFCLCLIVVIGCLAAALAAIYVTMWTLPGWPTLVQALFLLRLAVVITVIYAAVKLRAYYREFKV